MLGLKREIALRSKEFGDLRNEVTNQQLERENMLDQVQKSEETLEENKKLL